MIERNVFCDFFGEQSPLDRGPDLLNSRPLDEGFDTERALEESISRLLIDEFEDDDEDDEMIKMRLKRLGNAKVGSLNTYFLPPQVRRRRAKRICREVEESTLRSCSSLPGGE